MPDPVDVAHSMPLTVRDGHRPDHPEPVAPRLNDLPSPSIFNCNPLSMIHLRNSRSAAASPLRTMDGAPQEGQSPRCPPADVFTLLFIFAP